MKRSNQKVAQAATGLTQSLTPEHIGESFKPLLQTKVPMPVIEPISSPQPGEKLPIVDRVHKLFNTRGEIFPIVETISYSSRVDWLKGRPAWIADYANHYATSRHFIARSLNGRPDYLTQKISPMSKFNVFKRYKDIQFYLLVDLSSQQMALYYFDLDTNDRVHIKTYNVCLGKIAPDRSSGCLTPLGTFSLGSKVAIYKPGVNGLYLNRPTEMVKVFGTRWIPFEQNFDPEGSSPKGYGLQGLPFIEGRDHILHEDRSCIGKFESDGCIRFAQEDIEEIFSIVISRPSFVQIVKEFSQRRLPGIER
jgi:hypothetical protein